MEIFSVHQNCSSRLWGCEVVRLSSWRSANAEYRGGIRLSERRCTWCKRMLWSPDLIIPILKSGLGFLETQRFASWIKQLREIKQVNGEIDKTGLYLSRSQTLSYTWSLYTKENSKGPAHPKSRLPLNALIKKNQLTTDLLSWPIETVVQLWLCKAGCISCCSHLIASPPCQVDWSQQ
jgi:hypothetical protein